MRNIHMIAASALALALVAPADAQRRAGSQSGVEGRDVSARTWGEGETGDGSIGTRGGGEAEARNGGYAETDSRARLNERRAVQVSRARAADEDGRARSRTRTVTRNNGVIRSNSVSKYKQRGQPPVFERDRSVSRPD